MCGRYYLDGSREDVQALIARVGQGADGDKLLDMKIGEIFPKDTAPVLVAEGLRLMQWGFARYNGGGKVINGRSETAEEKQMFRKCVRERRCLLPASWYFEWRRAGNVKKEKYAVFSPGGGMQHMAGVYREERNAALPVFVILTREATPPLTCLHDRMPVILPPQSQEEWLSPLCKAAEVLGQAVQAVEWAPAQ